MAKNETPISLDELREILTMKGLDIKELAKEAKELKNIKTVKNKIVKKQPVKTSKPEFELALINYPDFVIRRSTAKTEKLMVFMISQDSYYIKTIKNGIEERTPLTRNGYGKFTIGMPDIEMPDDFWFETLKAGTLFYDQFSRILNTKALKKPIIQKYIRKSDIERFLDSRSLYCIEMYEKIPNILKAFPEIDFSREYRTIKELCDKFGLENIKDFIEERKKSLADSSYMNTGYASELLKYDFKYESFKQYILYDSVRMGFANDMYNFVMYWTDSLRMQQTVYGKIKEKYPKHLAEFHQQMIYKQELYETEINEKKFAQQSKETSKFEAKIDDFIFVAPKVPQDFYDEATEMHNCLAGYVERYTNGEDHIIFMRHKKDPEKSLVTIELSLDGQLLQAYQSSNRKITAEQESIIDKWLDKTVTHAIKKIA